MKNDWSFGGKADVPVWPVLKNGEKEPAALLEQVFDSAADADMKMSMLAAYGIPAFKYYEKEGAAGKVINGFSGFGVGLYVPASMAEDAQNLLASMPMPNEADE